MKNMFLNSLVFMGFVFFVGTMSSSGQTYPDFADKTKLRTAMVFGDVSYWPYPQDKRITKTYFNYMQDGLSQRGKWNCYNYYPLYGFQYEVLQAIHAQPLIDEFKPDVVVFHFSYTDTYYCKSTNGYVTKTDVPTFKSRLTTVVKFCRARQARVILLTPVHMQWNDGLKKIYGSSRPFKSYDPDGVNAPMMGHVEAVREVAREQQVELLDVYEILRKSMQMNRKKPMALMIDSAHINEEAHKLIGKKLVEMIYKPPQPPPPVAPSQSKP